MILEKNRVRIGYCQKLSGRVGYRVPVRHWAVAATEASPAAAAAARLQQSPPSHPTPLPHLKRKAYVPVCVSVPV